MQRYFAKDKKDKLILEDSDIHHIKNVMRMNIKDEIEVVYDNILYICEITSLNPLDLIIKEERKENIKSKYDVAIAIALVKEQKMDLILQKLTELGVNTIIPVSMERSIVKLDEIKYAKKKVRWESICKEASEQSKRTTIPKITDLMKIKDLAKLDYDLKLVASTKEKNNLLNNYLQDDNKCAKIIMVIGPEGGISPFEEEFLNNNGFESVSFGDLIFRVETAAIYASSILNYCSKG